MNTERKAEPLERPNIPEMDALLGSPQSVLDHGFVRLIDYMGDDAAIVQAARVSYGKGTKSVNDDRGLIRYLMSHRHTTPFEMCEIKLHVKLPIFVARQWIRHRTANVNEQSARYSILTNEFYVPAPEDVKPQSKANRQGRDGEFPEDVVTAMTETIRQQSTGAFEIYEELHSGWPWYAPDGERTGISQGDGQFDPAPEPHGKGHGMARELARTVLPVNAYTEWYWKVDLHNLLHFLSLRADPHAQKEIRVYAQAIYNLVHTWVPLACEAFDDYVLGAKRFSRQEMQVIRAALMHSPVIGMAENLADAGMSKREINEFLEKLDLGNGG